MKRALSILAAACILAPGAALAHTGAGGTDGIVHGLMHPVTGLDHVLAMVAVGVLAAFLGGRALWLVPASFVALAAVGGALGARGVPVPFVETCACLRRLASDGSQHRAVDRQYRAGVALCFAQRRAICRSASTTDCSMCCAAARSTARCRARPARAILATSVSEGPG